MSPPLFESYHNALPHNQSLRLNGTTGNGLVNPAAQIRVTKSRLLRAMSTWVQNILKDGREVSFSVEPPTQDFFLMLSWNFHN